MDAEIVTGEVSEFHCSLQSKAQYSTIPRSVDGEAVGVSEVVEGGSAFEYNKNCLREALCIIWMAEWCLLCYIWMAWLGVGLGIIGMIGFWEGCRFPRMFTLS